MTVPGVIRIVLPKVNLLLSTRQHDGVLFPEAGVVGDDGAVETLPGDGVLARTRRPADAARPRLPPGPLRRGRQPGPGRDGRVVAGPPFAASSLVPRGGEVVRAEVAGRVGRGERRLGVAVIVFFVLDFYGSGGLLVAFVATLAELGRSLLRRGRLWLRRTDVTQLVFYVVCPVEWPLARALAHVSTHRLLLRLTPFSSRSLKQNYLRISY